MHPLDEIVLPEVPDDDLDDVPLIGQRFLSDVSMAPMELHDWVVETGQWEEGVQAYLASISFAGLESLVGGGGGGKPHLATAGGKDVSKIDEAVEKFENIVSEFI